MSHVKPSSILSGVLLSLSAVASAQTHPTSAPHSCQPLGAYQITGISAHDVSVEQAIGVLLTGTPWRLDVSGTSAVTLSYHQVSGPLDQVLAQTVNRAGQLLDAPVAMTSDPSRCLLTLSLPVPAFHSAISAPASSVLPAGESLSAALEQYAEQHGWTLRWNIEEDYMLDVDLPLPAESFINTMTWVVNTYQSQGGLHGIAPRFAQTNRVVVIEHMNVREAN